MPATEAIAPVPAEGGGPCQGASFHAMPFGAQLEEGGVRFRLFAPGVDRVELLLDGSDEPHSMHTGGDGWHSLTTPAAHAGTRYLYRLPGGQRVPDPASRFQPNDVMGPSQVIDATAFQWTDRGWRGRAWEEAVLYELHVGTFTAEGTFGAAAERLPYLAELGVTAVELMAVMDFSGLRGWGYDGVLPFAPDSAYGRPDDLKALVDAAHRLGVQVIFDVVYNHFGPEGNFAPVYFPQMSSAEHETAWGRAMNFDGPGSEQVRSFFLHNALYWTEEFHADGLRLDASHAMVDHGLKHILDELAEKVRACAPEREIHLILEDEGNMSARLARPADGAPRLYTAQWNHDMTHLLSAAFGNLCPDRDPSAEETASTATMLAEGYVLTPTAQDHPDSVRCKVPPSAYIAFLQTHDLIGNRILAERLDRLVAHGALRAATAVLLLLPQTPMLFMGQEWMATAPFPFFCDYTGELAEKVRNGRAESLRRMHNTEDVGGAPDPGSEETFLSARLDWSELEREPHAGELAWFRTLLAVRRSRVVPAMDGLHERCGSTEVLAPGTFLVRWKLRDTHLTLAANLCGETRSGFPAGGDDLWLEGSRPTEDSLAGWSVRWFFA